nr:MAG TPA: hypothetical protein [Caudoviricetes sp.]
MDHISYKCFTFIHSGPFHVEMVPFKQPEQGGRILLIR